MYHIFALLLVASTPVETSIEKKEVMVLSADEKISGGSVEEVVEQQSVPVRQEILFGDDNESDE